LEGHERDDIPFGRAWNGLLPRHSTDSSTSTFYSMTSVEGPIRRPERGVNGS
jgi:hypothetical protein